MTFKPLALPLLCFCLLAACRKANPAIGTGKTSPVQTATDLGGNTAALAYATAMEARFIVHGTVDYGFMLQPADCFNAALGDMTPHPSPNMSFSELLLAPNRKSYALRVTATTGQQTGYSSADKVIHQ